jgi:protein-tyrosine phosphatase
MDAEHMPGQMGPDESPTREGDGAGDAFRLLFVCTGNTCRSPLAEVIARREADRLGWKGLEIQSAGVSASPGSPASEGARRTASRHSLDLIPHQSRQLIEEQVRRADLVLAMSPGHLLVLRELGGAGKSVLLADFAEAGGELGSSGGRSIPDPYGGGDAEYEVTFTELNDLIPRVLARLAPLISP